MPKKHLAFDYPLGVRRPDTEHILEAGSVLSVAVARLVNQKMSSEDILFPTRPADALDRQSVYEADLWRTRNEHSYVVTKMFLEIRSCVLAQDLRWFVRDVSWVVEQGER